MTTDLLNSLKPEAAPLSPPPIQAVGEQTESEFSLGELIATLRENKLALLAVTGLALLLGAFVLFNATPIYRANAMLQVESRSGSTALPQLQPLVNPTLDEITAVNAQIQIVQSRSILGRVVDKLKLDIIADPAYLPCIGAGIARRRSDLAHPLFGFRKYAWGGEVIRVDSLDVPRQFVGMTFTLVAADNGSYQLLGPDQAPVLQGMVGRQAAGGGVSVFISQLKARSGTHFSLQRISQEDAISRLKLQFEVKERRGSGMVDTTLTGPDAAALPVVLDEIINTTVRQDVEHHSAEAANTLKFLEGQLPALKSQVDAAESAYNTYRQNRGSVNLDLETQGVLASLVDVDKEIVKLQQERDDLRQHFTPRHPTMQAVDAKIALLNSQRARFDAQVAALPETQQTILRLKRDVEVSNHLYTDLLNSAQQLQISKAGSVGDARVIDPAMLEEHPIAPSAGRILGISAVFGLFASFAIIWLRRALKVVVDDPETIEHRLGLPVYAVVPRSKAEIALSQLIKSGKSKGELLATLHPEDDAVESLRSLRTTLHFALLDDAKSSVLIAGPREGIGKSFVCKNLGAVLAQSGQRVVIIDADLRKGHIHRGFACQREIGVSEYISGSASLQDVLKRTAIPGLTVITTGQLPPNPSELLMNRRFEELLEKLGAEHDTLIIDSPPILAVSDAAIIGRLCGATLLVARAGTHPIRELEQAVKRLRQAGVQSKGFVFNDLDPDRQRYRYGYKGYVYSYSYKA